MPHPYRVLRDVDVSGALSSDLLSPEITHALTDPVIGLSFPYLVLGNACIIAGPRGEESIASLAYCLPRSRYNHRRRRLAIMVIRIISTS